MTKKLNGAKVVKLTKSFNGNSHFWNYRGPNKHHGMMYRLANPHWCWEKDQLNPYGRLIFGVERFMWVYEKHPTKDEMWWRTASVDVAGNIM